jgi:hypothetical protein
MRRLALSVGIATWMIAGRSPLTAQSINGVRAGVSASPMPEPDTVRRATAFSPDPKPMPIRRAASLASLVIPGSGQYMLGNDRFVAYLAVEALGWWKYSKDIAERSARERDFKALAISVARKNFALPNMTSFPDADWLYYEWMRDFKQSGQFSLSSPGSPTTPETDTSTYNGKLWEIARGTQPSYEAALAQYEREAIRPEYRWSWLSSGLQYDQYVRLTDKRNDAARAAVKDLLLIGANHFFSMVDAFTTLRLQARTLEDGRTAVGAAVRW